MMAAEHTIAGEELMAYVDGELAADRADAVESHVAGCGACQELIADLRRVSGNLARWTVAEAPPAAAPQLPESRARARAFFGWRWPAMTWRTATYGATLAAGALAFALLVAPRTEQSAEQVAMRAVTGADSAPAAAAAMPPQGISASSGMPVEAESGAAKFAASPGAATQAGPRGPRVIHTASITMIATDFNGARAAIEQLVQELGGFVSTLHAAEPRDEKRSLRASLRVPAGRLPDALVRLRALGQVVDETQGGTDVTEQLVDLEARLANSRNTERRLAEVLKNRTGDLSDVLQVEREIARVRGEIEQVEAQQKRLEDRVSLATIALTVLEQRQASLDSGPIPVATQLRNAFVDGVQATYESIVSVTLVALRAVPFLLLWTIVLWWPVRKAYRISQGMSRPQA
ncbi:MAG: DUF4349 domain-containing protein [Vicinamibacterales bacterium]